MCLPRMVGRELKYVHVNEVVQMTEFEQIVKKFYEKLDKIQAGYENSLSEEEVELLLRTADNEVYSYYLLIWAYPDRFEYTVLYGEVQIVKLGNKVMIIPISVPVVVMEYDRLRKIIEGIYIHDGRAWRKHYLIFRKPIESPNK